MMLETKGIEIRHKGLLIFGILLLLIGLGASFYKVPEAFTWEERAYPYQGIGMILVLVGIVFIALGFLYSPRKQEPTKQST